MKNTLKFLFVALAMTAMISCGGAKKEETSTPDADTTTVVEPTPAPDTTATDTTANQ